LIIIKGEKEKRFLKGKIKLTVKKKEGRFFQKNVEKKDKKGKVFFKK